MSFITNWLRSIYRGHARLTEARLTIARLRAELDDAGEGYQGLSQQLLDAEAKVKTMTLMRDPVAVEKASLYVAESIEDIFAQGVSGRASRLRQVQTAIMGAVQEAIKGERDYDLGWKKRIGE